MKKRKLQWGASGDAMALMFIKLVTIVLGFAVTRLLSEYLSVYDYGTYSQIMLVISTVASLTILGMMDGVNYFYCSEKDPEKREVYIATIFTLQCAVSAAAGCIVMLLTQPLCAYFENPDVKRLLIFAAVLPLFQNLLSMLQVLLVSIGKAKVLAVRNLTVSLIRLAVVILVVTIVQDVAMIFMTTLVLDVAQLALFGLILRKNNCVIHLKKAELRLVKTIFRYCAPMAVFTMINALNRDIDKYLIAWMTDTETLAVYSNASKALPFDVIMASFCTVLLPEITRMVSAKENDRATSLYRVFLEIAYITNAILCCAALTGSPQLMELLYSRKYVSGLSVFSLYILTDLVRFTTITLILSAAGKTKTLMFIGAGALAANTGLNVLLYAWLGITGPALATLLTTLGMGIVLLHFGAKELQTSVRRFFDGKYLLLLTGESLAATVLFYQIQKWLAGLGLHYFAVLVIVCGSYCALMLLLNGKRILAALKSVNKATKKTDGEVDGA